jgi:type III secretion protein J
VSSVRSAPARTWIRSRPLVGRAGVGLVGLAGAVGCDVELYHDLPERRANEAVLALREAGVRADKRLEQRAVGPRPASFAVTVAPADEPRALQLLAERGLPRAVSPPATAASSLLGLGGDGRAAAVTALQASLGETLESLPAVQEARVHLALPEPEPLHPLGQLRPTASVLLRLRTPLPLAAADVALLVARAVPGLDAADVAVVSTPALAAPAPAGPTERPAAGRSATWLIPLLLSLCVALLGACVALLSALRRRPPPSPTPAPEPAGRRAFP